MKILVTGGAGFIGSNVVDAYIEAGHDVVVADDLSSGKRENINPGARFYEVDIRSPEMAEIIMDESPEVVNHHAAQMSVPASVEDPFFDADVNICGLLNILEASVKRGVKKVIFISSGGAVYGEAGEFPTGEGYEPEPMSPYAITKFAGEKYLGYYKNNYGIDFTVLRYANIYGPRQIPKGEAGVVAIFMDNILEGRSSTLYHFPDDEDGMSRDYTYVGDVTGANLRALEEGSGGVYNIGTSRAVKTKDLFDMIFNSIRKEVEGIDDGLGLLQKGGARGGDIRRSALKVALAAGELGWRPEVSLEEGIERTVRWRIGSK